jgi:hypothetical protein
MKSILKTLDTILGHIVAGVLTLFLYIALFLTAIVELLYIPYSFFEGAAGLSELDALELGILVLLGLVIWRFFRRGRQLNWGWWQMTRRFVFVVAIMGLILTMVSYVVLILELTEKGYLEVSFINRYAEADDFLNAAFIVLAIYAGAPLPALWQKQKAEQLGSSYASEQPASETISSGVSSDDYSTASLRNPPSAEAGSVINNAHNLAKDHL